MPGTNPFVSVPGTRDEIWASGLRNPWRFSWDTATGDLYVSDVGQNTMEELNVEDAGFAGGANYGWSVEEGTSCHTTSSCSGTRADASSSSSIRWSHAGSDSKPLRSHSRSRQRTSRCRQDPSVWTVETW